MTRTTQTASVLSIFPDRTSLDVTVLSGCREDTRQLSPTRHRCLHPGKPTKHLAHSAWNCRHTSSEPDSTETLVGNEKVMVSLSRASETQAVSISQAHQSTWQPRTWQDLCAKKALCPLVVCEIVASTTSSKLEPHTDAHQRASPPALRGMALLQAKSGESSCSASRRALTRHLPSRRRLLHPAGLCLRSPIATLWCGTQRCPTHRTVALPCHLSMHSLWQTC